MGQSSSAPSASATCHLGTVTGRYYEHSQDGVQAMDYLSERDISTSIPPATIASAAVRPVAVNPRRR